MSERLHHGFLRRELPRWQAEGLIDVRAAEAIAARYGLDDREATGLALSALYLLAASLVGGGVVSLVAWHWDEMGDEPRLAILGAALLAAHVAGFRMWRGTGRQPRLGHAISLLGTIVFGASIGLVAQIFQVSGPWYGIFGAWALGASAAGLLLGSVPALCLSAFLGLFIWAPGFLPHTRLPELVAWGVGGGALAIALWRRSRVLLVVCLVGLAVVVASAAAPGSHDGSDPGAVLATLLAIAASTGALASWAPGGRRAELAPAGAVARLGFYGVAFTVSFLDVAEHVVRDGPGRGWLTCALPAALVAGALLLATPAGAADRPRRVTAAMGLALAVALGLAVVLHGHARVLAVLGNLALLAAAAAWVGTGLSARDRRAFWEGLAVASAVALARFFEIEHLLWLKGIGFICCGVALVVGGVLFERRLRARAEVDHV